MKTSRAGRLGLCVLAVSLLLLPSAVVLAVAPQSVSGTYLEIDIDSDGSTQSMHVSLGPDRVRVDMASEMSLVSLGGDDGKMLMIQHAEHQYMEFTKEMMEAMAGMIGQMPQQMNSEMEDVAPPTFVRTGKTKQVGEWNAYEVRVEHPDQTEDVTMWFSQDVDADFRALAEQMMSSLSSMLNNPMLQGMTGAGGGPSIIEQFQSQMSAVDIPDGFPVQVISNAGGSPSTTTLKSIDQNASFGPDTWQAPEGYTKMDLPFIRR